MGEGAFSLQNERLSVEFEMSGMGPRMTAVTVLATDRTCRFGNVQEIGLAVVPPERVHDPELVPRYRMQDEYCYVAGSLQREGTSVDFVLTNEQLQARTAYELAPGTTVLRKTVTCTAGENAVYVAGVMPWNLRPLGVSALLPKPGATGQPMVFADEQGGYFLTLESPLVRNILSQDGHVQIEYRPGYRLSPGESREVASSAIGFFECNSESSDRKIEAARQSFFAYVAEQVKPDIPCPVKFTTWGPWMGQARADRVLETMDDMARVGTDIFHFDAGWQQPEYPYSKCLPAVRDADDETWDRRMTQAERLPDGLLPIAHAARERGMVLSLWFDGAGSVFVREGDEWAALDKDGEAIRVKSWEGRYGELPVQGLTSPEYAGALSEFVRRMRECYSLGGVMFDNVRIVQDYSANHDCLAGGWNAPEMGLRTLTGIFDEAFAQKPGIYRFLCQGSSWPWALKHATHIHAGDPGTEGTMAEASATDYPARALAYERYLAWLRHYDNFVPPWGIKGDIAGWSVQQKSPIPINLEHTGQLIPSGEGWTVNMFTCFATTAVRDIRFSFRQMPEFDKKVLKEWLAWDRQRTHFIFNCRPLLREASADADLGVVGTSHVGRGRGVIYLFNRSFDLAEATVTLDEQAGFCPEDKDLAANIVYPMKASLGSGPVSYGQTINVPIIGKDCLVIEVGLEKPDEPASYDEYERTAQSVIRSFDTVFLSSPGELLEAVAHDPVRLETGSSPRDRRLAAQILESIGAYAGNRPRMDHATRVRPDKAGCRIIVGSHEGLADHPEVGRHFRETLYNRYVEWDGRLISAPMVSELPGGKARTFCLVAPRPEQLARLAIDLVARITEGSVEIAGSEASTGQGPEREINFAVRVPPGRPVLRFKPVVRQRGHVPVPGDLEIIRFEIRTGDEQGRALLWREDIPPFCGPQWWDDRVISLAEFAGRDITVHLSAAHVDGRSHPQVAIGYEGVSVLELRNALP